MPQMNNITVVETGTSTSIVFDKLQPASGDDTTSMWRYLPAGKPVNCAETFGINTRFNGPKTVRRITGNYEFPIFSTDATTGKVTRTDVIRGNFTFNVLQNTSLVDTGKAVDHFTLLLRDALVREIMTSGYNAT